MNFRSKTLFITILLLLGISLNAYANPQGANVVSGSATFTTTPNTLTINTASNKTIINYNSFSIAANESTIINQPSASSAVLNRVIGVDPSSIEGTLSSNGQLFLVNPNGIIFGPNSKINAPAILASTLDITDNDFLNGNYNFFKNGGSAFIINQGRLAASPGGYIALLSQAVNNQGVIVAPLGTVALAAGDKLTLALDSQSQISVAIDDAVQNEVIGPDGKQIKSAIQNSGTIQANGGKVLLTAKVLNDVFDYAVNNSGVIEAGSLQNKNGVVELVASGAPVINTGTIKASQINVSVPESTLINQGQINSQLTAGLLNFGNISIDALGIQQDGLITADDTIDITANDVNTTIPFQNTATSFPLIKANQVNITANNLGGAGLPVAIDASNINFNKTSGDIDIAGSQGIGSSVMITGPPAGFGSIIYNPDTNLTLNASSGSISISEGASLAANNLTLESQNGIYSAGSLITPNIMTLMSDGDIYSLGVLDSSSLIESGNTFQVGGIFDPGNADVKNADNAITYSSNTSVSGVITDAASIVVDAGITLTMTANTTFNAGTAFTMDPTSTIAGGGYNLTISALNASTLGNINNVNLLTLSLASGSTPVTFTSNSSSTFQVNTVKTNYRSNLSRSVGTGTSSNPIMIYSDSNASGGLQYIPTSGLGLYYQQANNIDASETSSWNSGAGFVPIGNSSTPFTGTFNGNSDTISNLFIDRSSTNYIGLFGYTSGANISNVGLTNVSITGQNDVGGLAGVNYDSTITNSYTTGSVTGGSTIGGLVGLNYDATISDSYSTGLVTGNSSGNYIGGLVGQNYSLGDITGSYATGEVLGNSGSGSSELGGLVGFDYDSTISNSYATGEVLSTSGSSELGGLVGGIDSYSNTTISNSYATGAVTGGYYTGGLVGQNAYSNISNSYATGAVNGGSGSYIGGLVGYNAYSTVSDSYATGAVTDAGSTVGGLVGLNYDATISNSYATGSVVGGAGTYTGGLVGQNFDPGGGISYSYATGVVTGGTATGGLVAYNYDSAISNSYATGSVTGFEYVGGLVGSSDSLTTISNSYATGAVEGYYYVGGLVGATSDTSISNTYATGYVTEESGGADAGGLLGVNTGSSSVSNSFTTGTVTGSGSDVGGLIGDDDGSNTLTNNWWYNSQTYGIGSSGTAQSTGHWQKASALSDFYSTGSGVGNLYSTWTFGSSGGWDSFTSTYPHLYWEWSPTITTLLQLQNINLDLSASYTLANNIDATGTKGWNAGTGFVPIGNSSTPFTGTFNGEGYTVSNLFIDLPSTDNVGLFGYTSGSTIENVGLINVNVTGYFYVGGLVGSSSFYSSTISNSYAGGSVTGYDLVGGLVGDNYDSSINSSYSTGNVSSGYGLAGGLSGDNNGSITNSYSNANVSGTYAVGGLVGDAYYTGSISNSYATGSVTGSSGTYIGGLVGETGYSVIISNSYSTGSVIAGGSSDDVGGLVGANFGTINNSFTTGNVTGSGTNFGGLTGYNSRIITDSYAAGEVTGSGSNFGGLIGYNTGSTTLTNNWWYNSLTYGIGNDGTAQSTGNWQEASALSDFYGTGSGVGSLYSTWSFGVSGGWDSFMSTYPHLYWEWSPTITTLLQLQNINLDLSDTYTLGNNINAAWTAGWNSGTGFVPIGNSSTPFTGTFNGEGYTISNLFIDSPSTNDVGLFGYTTGATISNVGLVNANITGQNVVGGLVGNNYNSSAISNSYATGSVTGSNQVGGLVGYNNYSSISNSYVTASVTGSGNAVGGLVGDNNGPISNSYSTGNVTGSSSYAGGLVGTNSGIITNSFTIGNVAGSGIVLGGLAGNNSGIITNSYFTDNAYGGGGGGTYESGGATAFNSAINPVYAIGATGGWNISPTEWGFSGGLPILSYQISNSSFVWSGAISTNWSTASNWLGGVVPGSGANITIYPGTYSPVLSSNITPSNVYIEPGAIINPSTYSITGTDLIDYGTLMAVASTYAGNYSFSSTVLESGSTVNYSGSTQTIANTLSYYNLTTSGSGTQTLGGTTTVNANLTNNTTLDLNGQSLTVTGTLTNNGTLKLLGSETPSIGTFSDNGTTDYFGSGSYTIAPIGTYNNLQFDNGTFTLGGSATFTANGNITLDPGVTLNMTANTSLIAGNSFTMGSTDYITGGSHNLSITADNASTLENISSVNSLTLNSGSDSNGVFSLESALTVSSLTNNATFDLNGQSLTVSGTLTNNGTLGLIGSETPSIGTFTDNGITDYYGSGSYTIVPLGTYNYLQFDNGMFTLGGSSTFNANGSISIDPNVTLYMPANTTFTTNGAFLMDPTATIQGGGYNLSISAWGASTLGNINYVDILNLGPVVGEPSADEPVHYYDPSGETFNVTTTDVSSNATLDSTDTFGYVWKGFVSTYWKNIGNWLDEEIPPVGASFTVENDPFYPILLTSSTYGNVTINAGAIFDPASNKLSGGTLSNYGTLWVIEPNFTDNYNFISPIMQNYSSVNYIGNNQTINNSLFYSNLNIEGTGTTVLNGLISASTIPGSISILPLVLGGSVNIDLSADTTFFSASTFSMASGTTINGGDNTLDIEAGVGFSSLGNINNVSTLTLDTGTFHMVTGSEIKILNLTNDVTFDLHGQSLTVTNTLTNTGTLELLGNEDPDIGTFTDNGTTDYYGSGYYIITPLGTYNNLVFDNGPYILDDTLTAKGNITLTSGVALYAIADISLIAGNKITMASNATIIGDGDNLSIFALNASTLGNIGDVNLLSLNLDSGLTPVTFTSNSGSTFDVNTVQTNYGSILLRSIGTGSPTDPIMIYSDSNAPGGLQYINTSGLGLYYEQANNIDATETSSWGAGFVPIGNLSTPFTGVYDGDIFKISNLTINTPSNNYVGLFGYTSSSAVLTDIQLSDADILGKTYVGGLVGYNDGGFINSSSTTGDVSSYYYYYTVASSYVGGLVGWNDGDISNSHSDADVKGSMYVGGLAGINTDSISNSYSTGDVISNAFYVGGLVGDNNGYGSIADSDSSGNVSNGNGSDSNYYFVGGLVGVNEAGSSIDDSFSSGNVSSIGGEEVGGLAGVNAGDISNSSSTGDVSGNYDVGGLVGYNYLSSTILSCSWYVIPIPLIGYDEYTLGPINTFASSTNPNVTGTDW